MEVSGGGVDGLLGTIATPPAPAVSNLRSPLTDLP
jgi:hypothetical protein